MQPTTTESTQSQTTSPRTEHDNHRRLRLGYTVASGVLALAVLLQVFLAGSGLFTNPSWWPMHEMFGMILSLGPLVLLALGFAARLPRLTLVLTALLFVLIGLQPVLINVAGLKPFHVVNAVLIFALTVMLGHQVGSRLASPAPAVGPVAR